MTSPALTVGDPVDSMCTKCKQMRRHTVIALQDGQPARVQCRICEGFHNYRAPRKAAPPRERAARAAPATRVSQPRPPKLSGEYEKAVGALDPALSVPYRMDSRYASGDILHHPTFGLGLVHKAIPPDKVEVWFPGGPKRLRCAP